VWSSTYTVEVESDYVAFSIFLGTTFSLKALLGKALETEEHFGLK